MEEEVEEQLPSQGRQEKLHYSAAEVSEYLRNRAEEKKSIDLIRNGDVVAYMNAENKRWLKENAETPEEAEQLMQIYENAQKLQETVAKFSKDDPDIPASEETKQKLNALDNLDNSRVINELRRQVAIGTFLLPTIGAGAFEMFNLAGGGTIAPPGLAIKVGLAIGAGIGGSIEGYAHVTKGAKKLKALIERYKTTGVDATQPSPEQTERDKI